MTYFHPLNHLISPAVDYGRRLQCILARIPAIRPRLQSSQPPAGQEERPLQLHGAASFVLQNCVNSCGVTWSLTLTEAHTDPASPRSTPKMQDQAADWAHGTGVLEVVTQSWSTHRKGKSGRETKVRGKRGKLGVPGSL